MIDIMVWLAVLAVVLIVCWFVISQMTLPEPVRKIVTIVMVVVVAVVAIMVLLSLTGAGPPLRLPR